VAAAAGIGLFGWTIVSVGARQLGAQLQHLASVLPLIAILAGLRFSCQAAGWRLAMPAGGRPTWSEVFGAVIAGEAAGYLAWGPVSREPMKAFLVAHRLPQRAALRAAMIERFVYSLAAGALIVAAIGIAAVRHHFLGWFLIGSIVSMSGALGIVRWRPHRADRGYAPLPWRTVVALGAMGIAQELSNLIEAYVVLAWLGSAPTVSAVVALEGLSRLMNSAGQFIPGKLGVTEAATTALAEGLRLGGTNGLSLALARRIRSLLWGAIGIALVAMRAAAATSEGKPRSQAMAVRA